MSPTNFGSAVKYYPKQNIEQTRLTTKWWRNCVGECKV